jgi:quercetin dioxygenase-like cupin family protein
MKRIEPATTGWQASRGYRKRRLLSPAALAAEGALIQEVVVEPDAIIPPHFHHHAYEFYYVLDGQCLLTVNGSGPLRLQAGDMLLLEPRDVHRLHNDGTEPFRLLVFKTNAASGDIHWADETPG